MYYNYYQTLYICSTNIGIVKSTEEKIPIKLKAINLFVNTEKPEKYNIKRNGNEEWKICKYLGTILDSEKDIKRRKGLGNS